MNETITVREAAERLGITCTNVRRRLQSGSLTAGPPKRRAGRLVAAVVVDEAFHDAKRQRRFNPACPPSARSLLYLSAEAHEAVRRASERTGEPMSALASRLLIEHLT